MNDEKIGCVQHDCQECKARAAAPQPVPKTPESGGIKNELAQPQPTANSGDAEKAVLDRMAKYVSTITQSEIDEADSDRGITSPQAQPQSDEQARFQAQQQFLQWNRQQETPLVAVAHEYSVFRKAVDLYIDADNGITKGTT